LARTWNNRLPNITKTLEFNQGLFTKCNRKWNVHIILKALQLRKGYNLVFFKNALGNEIIKKLSRICKSSFIESVEEII